MQQVREDIPSQGKVKESQWFDKRVGRVSGHSLRRASGTLRSKRLKSGGMGHGGRETAIPEFVSQTSVSLVVQVETNYNFDCPALDCGNTYTPY